MNPFADKPILVPVDLSDVCDRAVGVAQELAAAPEKITVLHVGLPYVAPEVPYMPWEGDDTTRRHTLEKTLSEHFAGQQYRGMRLAVRLGDPAEEIASYARQIGAGLIVMPSHGRRGLAHLVMGSVAERVVQRAPCPVLVLRGLKEAPAPGEELAAH